MSDELRAVMQVFEEACNWDKDGEVVLRCGERTGRVFFSGGQIAWARVSTIDRTFTDYLADHSTLNPEDIDAVYEECEEKGTHVAETIVEWGLLDEPTVRRLLLEHISECLFEIFSWPQVQSMFMPDDRHYKHGLTYDFAEILQVIYLMNEDDKLPLADLKLHAKDGLRDRLRTVRGPLPELEPEAPESETLPEMPLATDIRGEVFDGPDALSLDLEETPRPGLGEELTPAEPGRRGLFLLLGLLTGALLVGIVIFLVKSGEPAPGPLEAQPLKPAPEAEPAPPEDSLQTPVAETDGGPIEQADGSADPAGDAEDAGQSPALDAGATEGADDQGETPPPQAEGILYGAEGDGTCTIRLLSSRRGKVYLDGVYTGKTTPTRLWGVAAGVDHMLMVEASGRRPAHKILSCKKGKTLKVKLYPKRARNWRGWVEVDFESDPAGAFVYVDGRRKAKTPAAVKLKASKRSKVELRKKGYKKFRRTMRPTPGEKLTFRAKLSK